MPHLTLATTMPVPASAVYDWHTRRAALERLTPPWESVAVERFDGVADGGRAEMQVGMGPFNLRWIAEHQDVEHGRQFRDVQVKGPFHRWNHLHRMEPIDSDECVLHDDIDYDLPLGRAGERTAGSAVRHRLQRMFTYRHRIAQQDLAAHARYRSREPFRIAVSGASGLIGSNLVTYLRAGGHEVFRLVRARTGADDAIYWNHRKREIELDRLEGLDAVIHLAGENIFALQWSEQKRMTIYDSRVHGTAFLAGQLTTLQHPPHAFLCASTIGIYGDRGDDALTEDDAPGERGFATAVCRDWEDAAREATKGGIRTVNLRFGVIMTPQGGVLAFLHVPFLLGLGGYVGKADSYVPWIALDDVVQSIYHLVVADVDGPVNLCSPHPVQSRTLANRLGTVLRRPALLHLPAGPARFVLGQTAEELALSSAQVHPARLEESDYRFCYPHLEDALRHQLGRTLATEVPQLASDDVREVT